MSSSSSLDSCWMSDKTDKKKKSKRFEVQRRDILHSNTGRYLVLDFSGEGCFGKVAKCVNLVTAQTVALKILKTEESASAKREINMLEVVSVLDPVKKNIVRFFDKFKHEGHTCLAFEMLDRNLHQLLIERHWKPLSLSEIRPIAQQLLTALDALKGIGVIHSDLKPDNIMLVNHQDEPFRVKLIDFGLSHTTSEVKHGMKIQPLGYRAPEVTLGHPLSEAIDMWSLGCVLTFLYVGKHPFAVNCEYQMMRNIVEIVGQPADHILFGGKYSQTFFRLSQHFNYAKWWLKTPREYKIATGIEPKVWRRSFTCLDDLTTLYPETQEFIELEDGRVFVDLLKCLLDTDPERRITSGEAPKHPYVTMAHLADELDISSYVDNSVSKMLVCSMDNMEEELTDSKAEVKGVSALLCSNGEGSAPPHSQDAISNRPSSTDGAEVVGNVNTGGSVEAGPAADGSSDQNAATTGPTKEGSATASTGLAPEGPAADGSSDQDAATTGPTKEGSATTSTGLAPVRPAADGAKDQDEASTGPTKEGSATTSTALAPEGPAADGAKDQDEASTGPTKEGLAATMTVSSPEGPAADGSKHQDVALTGLAKETAANYRSPDEGAPVKIRSSPLKRMRKFFGRIIRTLLGKKK